MNDNVETHLFDIRVSYIYAYLNDTFFKLVPIYRAIR
jgi:hypothetical protein